MTRKATTSSAKIRCLYWFEVSRTKAAVTQHRIAFLKCLHCTALLDFVPLSTIRCRRCLKFRRKNINIYFHGPMNSIRTNICYLLSCFALSTWLKLQILIQLLRLPPLHTYACPPYPLVSDDLSVSPLSLSHPPDESSQNPGRTTVTFHSITKIQPRGVDSTCLCSVDHLLLLRGTTVRIRYEISYEFHLTVLLNLLNPTGHVMHQQFNIQQLYVLPTLYLCVLCLSENKQRLVPLTA